LLEGNVPEALPQGGVLLLQYSTGKRPCTEWEVSHSKFKALAYLESGQNEIILEYATDEATEPCISKYTLTYHPMTSCPPVKLVILQAIGSKLAHEPSSVPGETFLSVAMAKFRMAAYLWQAYMGDRIDINNYGRRTFQLENLWKHSTLYSQDQETKEMRNEAPVYNIILDKSVDELKQLSETDMISCVERALMKRFKIQYGNQGYFACMFLDAEWDDTNKALMGAISYGGRGKLFASRLNLALFGAHLTFSYPSSINTVPQAFSNATATPGLPGITQGECASLGIGSHLKQVGHMLGLPNQADGIMGNEYTQFARAFSFQNNSKALEPQLHPLDIIRLRHHPLFQSPFIANDRDGVRYNTGIVIWGGCKSTISINSRAGITAIEILLSRDNVCNHWLDLLDSTGRPRSNFQLHLAEILKQVPSSRSLNRFLSHPGPFALRILTADGKSTPVMDFTHFATRLVSRIPGDKRKVSRSQLIGTPAPNSTHGSVILPQSVHLLAVKVYSTRRSVVGMEFVLTDETKLFGARTNDRPVEFEFAWGMGEMIMGLELRVKQHVCGLSFFTTLGRQSEWFGGALGIE
jgi:hypothetical protein